MLVYAGFYSRDTDIDISQILPYDYNNPIKDIVGVLDIAEGTKGQQFEKHFQDKHASEDDVADLQNICQLRRL